MSYCLGGTDKRIIFADVKLIYSTNLIVSEMKKYNFGAGPSILPQEVMKATADACVEFQGMGLSLMEISHRTKEFQAVMDEAQALFKELLNIPEGYSVLFWVVVQVWSSAWCPITCSTKSCLPQYRRVGQKGFEGS